MAAFSGGRLRGDMAPNASAKEVVQRMLAVEDAEALRKGRYVYLSKERSERTGGREWTERVVETSVGRMRRLVAEDGHVLTGQRAQAEQARLADIASDPEGFRKRSEALKNDEQHAKEMLGLLSKAFLFDGMHREGDFMRINFKPDPGYAPQSLEERVLHGMVGTMLVDTKTLRLRRLEGRLPADVNLGFGLLATIKAGSNFSTTREPVPGNEWKTAVLDTDINGHAIFFKAIGKKAHAEHTEFVPVPMEMTVAQAAAMLQR
ncbi:hypothetical protein [Granulicella sp. dw_53]|uniref:hypothetical protein n=1 Tax=Granulicella sp. dw_53 TaxID=2719792 RepID=UPI001BD3C99F|nr:hypothetical protein [Granulicella sp. dw_53]